MTDDPRPRFSLVTVVGEASAGSLRETAYSLREQLLPDWEWVLVGEAPAVVDELTAADRRIRALGAGTPADGVAAARGRYVGLLDAGDVLEPRALRRMSRSLGPDVDLVYSDHDEPAAGGTRVKHRKPAWSPERLRHQPYLGRLVLLRRSAVDEVGGLRTGLDGAEELDLMLRVTERSRHVVHVPAVLCHRGTNVPLVPPGAGARRVVQEHVDRLGLRATAEPGHLPGLVRLLREPDLTTPVSVVIPTIGSSAVVRGRERHLVVEAVRSVRAASRHQDLEFVVVYDSPTPADVLAELRALPGVRLTLVEFTEPFNFSAKCNLGARHATGEVLVFLNDDVEAVSDGTVEQLIAPLREEGVGATGAKLLFPTRQIQHAGVTFGGGTFFHSYYRKPHPDFDGALGDLWVDRETTALTGACLAVRREVFDEVGGFFEGLPVNYNDVDLCLRIAAPGRRLLWLHDVVLWHFESVSRSPDVAQWETDLLKERWGDVETVGEQHTLRVR